MSPLTCASSLAKIGNGWVLAERLGELNGTGGKASGNSTAAMGQIGRARFRPTDQTRVLACAHPAGRGLPVASLRSQLLLDRGKIDPSALPADQAVAKVEDVQEAGLDGSASPVQTEWVPRRGGV